MKTRRIDIFGFHKEQPDRSNVPECYQEFLPENIEKDRYTYPYTYSPFIVYLNTESEKPADNSLYTDRFLMWDWDKHNRLCKKHFGNDGQMWHDRDHEKIQAFLCDWLERDVVLVANIQYVNLSSGYPLWRLDFHNKE